MCAIQLNLFVSMAIIECENICLSYDQQEVFEDFNLKIEEGDFVCVSGESGKGKTTLLKLIQGFEVPLKGRVRIDGEELNEKTVHELRNKMVWVPQNINLPVTNGANLVELLDIKGNVKQVGNYLRLLGLNNEILKKDFAEISGGQKQRIVIATCLSIDRPIIVLDEPTSSLDETTTMMLVDTLKGLNGKTIVSASHNKTWKRHVDMIIEL